MTIYVSIGNSDDRLSQSRWASYYAQVDALILSQVDAYPDGGAVHGRFVTDPVSAYQSACWAIDLPDLRDARDDLREALAHLATAYEQDSVAWVEGPVQMIQGRRPQHTYVPLQFGDSETIAIETYAWVRSMQRMEGDDVPIRIDLDPTTDHFGTVLARLTGWIESGTLGEHIELAVPPRRERG